MDSQSQRSTDENIYKQFAREMANNITLDITDMNVDILIDEFKKSPYINLV